MERKKIDFFFFGGEGASSHVFTIYFPQIKLADKQAALEKIQWEAMTSNREVEKLQEELDSARVEISSFMLVFESLTKSDSTAYADDYDITPNYLDSLSCIVSS